MTDGAVNTSTCSFTVTVGSSTEVCDGLDNDCDGIIDNGYPTVTLDPFAPVCLTDPTFSLTGGLPTGGTYSGPGVSGGQFDPSAAGTGTHTITYSYTNTNNCTGTVQQTITVLATPTVSTPANQTVCNGSPTAPVNFSGNPGATFSWTCSDPSIGLPANGTGNIASFTAINTGTSPIVATITATPGINTGEFAYIPNYNDNTVSVINTLSNTVVATIPTPNGIGPYGVSVSLDGNWVYVANEVSKNVSVINTTTHAVSYISTPNVIAPVGIIVSPNGNWVYVSNNGSNEISVINTTTNAVYYISTNANAPTGISVSPNGNWVYVADQGSNNISVINTTTNAVSYISTPNGIGASGISVSPDGNWVYVANYISNNVTVINTTTNAVSYISTPNGFGAAGISVSPDGNWVYVANYISENVSVINTTTNVVSYIATPNGDNPLGISVSPDGNWVYVSNQSSNNVTVINTATNSVVGTVGVGNIPSAFGNFITGPTCSGSPVSFTITVNPSPTTANAGSDFFICDGSVTNLSANMPVIGIGSWSVVSGPSTALNQYDNVTLPTAIFTPGGGAGVYQLQWSISNGSCPTSTDDMDLTVIDLPTVSTPANQTVCNGSPTAAVNFSGSPGATFSWTCSDPSIGLPANGTGNIASFTAMNTGTSPIVATITATPLIGTGEFAYIPNFNDNTVSVINTLSNTVVATIPTPYGIGPFGISASLDGNWVYVANEVSKNVSVINTATYAVSYISTPDVIAPTGIIVSPNGNWVYVSNNGSNISVINTTTNAVSYISTNRDQPTGISMSPNGNWVYVTDQFSNNILVINTLSNTVVATIPTPAGINPSGIRVSPDGNWVYVANFTSKNVSVINTTTHAVSYISTPNGYGAVGISVSPDGNWVYVANYISENVTVINTATNAVSYIANPNGDESVGISVSPNGNWVYVSNYSSDNVTVINTATNSVVNTISVGAFPTAYGNFITGLTCTGSPVTFTITVQPTVTEVCNGLDDDCDGSIDEGTVCCPTVLYVKANAIGLNNGLSWTNAFTSLQSALVLASTCPSVTQIWVASGTYKPTPTTNRTISFVMKNNLAIYGGFPNMGNPVLTDRNWVTNVTTLSGDIGTVGNNSDNSNHVILNNGLDGTAVLDGFTIMGGNSNQSVNYGGGMYNYLSSPSLSNCLFFGNSAANGGGLFNSSSSPNLTNCAFSGNTASNDGGMMYNYLSSPSLTNCTFSGNSASSKGGGMLNQTSSPNLTNCIFSGNSAPLSGGGMFSYLSSPSLNNCTFSGNLSSGGGAIHNVSTNAALKNCIIWGNSSGIVNQNGSSATYTSTIVQGLNLIPGAGVFNGSTDPLFVSQPAFSSAPTTAGNLRLQVCSPAIDKGTNAGAPAIDLDGNPRIHDGDANGTATIDPGAYEFQGAPPTWYYDKDDDKYSDGTTLIQCTKPNWYEAAINLIQTSGDCQDGTGNVTGYPNAKKEDIHPYATEVCNSIDDNCNGTEDEGLLGFTFNNDVSFTTQAEVDNWPSCYTKIIGKLTISNTGVNSLAPLFKLTEVTKDVTIQNNNSLASLNGLQSLTIVGDKLKVSDNDILSDCCQIEALLMGNGVGGTKDINNNLTNCNTEAQILAYCPIPFNGGGGTNLVITPPCPGCSTDIQATTSLSVNLFPNPTTGELTLEFQGEMPKTGTVQILDLWGRVVLKATLIPGEHGQALSLAAMPAGVYFVKVLNDGVLVWVEKVVKQ